MPQAEGSQSRIIIANELTYKSPPEQIIHPCEAAFDELVDPDVTATLDAADRQVGTNSLKLEVAAGASAGDILATDVIAPTDLSSYTHVGVRIKSSIALDAGDLQLLLDNTAQCASPLETLNIPAVPTNTWTFAKIALSNPALALGLISVGLRMAVDKGEFILHIDDIKGYNPAVVVPIKTEDVSASQELLRSEVITDGRNRSEPSLGNVAIDGNITTELAPYMVRLFHHMLGVMAVIGSSAPYTYKAIVGALPTGLTYEKGFRDIGKFFRNDGAHIGSWKISGAAGKINPLELGSIMGAKETINDYSFDPLAVSYAHKPFTTFKCQIKEGAGGTVLGTVTEFSIEGNNDLEGDNYVIDGTGERYSIPAGQITVTGSLTALFTNTTMLEMAKAGTTTKLVIEMWHGTGTGATAGNEKMIVTMDEIKFKPKSPAIDGPKGIKQALDFEAFYAAGVNGSSIMFEVLLPNNTTLY